MSGTTQSEHKEGSLPLPAPVKSPPTSLPMPKLPYAPMLGAGGAMAPDAATSIFGHYSDVLTNKGQTFPIGPVAGPQAGPTVAAAGPAAGPAGPEEKHKPTREEYKTTLDAQLDASIKGNRSTRATLDKAKKDNLPTAGATQTQLDGDRNTLLDQLKERSGVYDGDIAAINAQLGDKLPKNLTPEQKALIAQRTQLETEKNKYSDQQTALQRWHDRGQINSINEQLKDPALDPKERTRLLAEKKTLATGLLSTTKSYQQFDDRWGDTVYGKDKSYTSMTEAGCGPTALAMLMDFRDQEDPEGKHSQGEKDPYTPRKMADYATNHGRVKGSGTSGDVMFNDLAASFPGYSGHNLNNRAGAVESLRDGIPVAFLGHDIHGTRADGTDTKYGGHFMLLNGVSDDGKTFDVHDGGRNASRNIRTISDKQLGAGAAGYWNVDH